MVKPTAAEYRADTRIDWAGLGLPDPDPIADTVLQDEIDDSWAYIEEKACALDLDTLDGSSSIGRLALRAVKLRTIQQAIQGQGAFIGSSVSNLIKSFAVPGYSETRADPTQMYNNKFMHSIINEWPVLADLIWTIMPEECRDKLLALYNNDNPPASSIVEHDWFYPGGMFQPSRYDDPYQ